MNDIIYMTDENGDLAIMWFGRVLARVKGTQPYTSVSESASLVTASHPGGADVIDVSTPAAPMLVERDA